MQPPFDIITFDCYGTLIDWQEGIAGAFLAAAREDGIALRREDVLATYEATEPVVERERYRPYRDVLTESAWRVAHALGWALAYERATFLVNSLATWKPFPDTNPALERLRASGIQLGILSNVDSDLLAATRRHFTVPFDVIVTADQVRSYKPAPGHFRAARESIDSGARWLHAAQSNFHDIVPANAMGIPTAWVNRRGQRALPGGVPTVAEVRDLSELL
jgi:2-haloalkanoic acid dehalogenase type II